MKTLLRRTAVAACLTTSISTGAFAAGYDTPMLYSARHMGMGGTAIGAVDDPSAIFHNPAGMSHIKGGMVLLDFSPLIGTIHGSPSDHKVKEQDGSFSQPGMDIGSNTTFAPFFMAGGAYTLHQFLTLGFAVYPVASAGASYTYSVEGSGGGKVDVKDHTRLAFIDFAPAISAQLLPNLRIGAAYRYSTVEFDRQRVNPNPTGTPLSVDLAMKGSNYEGFRVGAQFNQGPIDVGLVYRHKTMTEVTADTGILENQNGTDIKYAFILPSKLGLGVQWKAMAALRLALDLEYTWQEQNDTTNLAGTGNLVGLSFPVKVPNVSKWGNNVTARVGGGYKIGAAEIRAGYTRDAQAANVKYPSAFGTPPATTHVVTAGFGYELSDTLDFSLAGAYRTGSAEVSAADVKDNGCPFCGKAGTYEISLFGAYLDLRWKFGAPKPAPVQPMQEVKEATPAVEATPTPAAEPPAAPPVTPAAPPATTGTAPATEPTPAPPPRA